MNRKNAIADRYDRIASSAPVNATAARAFSMSGTTEPEKAIPPHIAHYDTPPPIKAPPAGKEHRVGKKYGTLTVLGYLRSQTSKTSSWLVRCVCGQYEVRTGKAIDRGTPDDRCVRCRRIFQLQRRTLRQAHFDRHGRWPADEKDRTNVRAVQP